MEKPPKNKKGAKLEKPLALDMSFSEAMRVMANTPAPKEGKKGKDKNNIKTKAS